MNLQAYWNYDDPAASEARFRELLATATGDARLEVMTQIARTYSLRRRFADAHALLDQVEPQLGAAGLAPRLRYLLERGRTFRSDGARERARPLFEQAWTLGQNSSEEDLTIDAAHMLALVESGAAAMAWNERALQLARHARDPEAHRWVGPLVNNLGGSLREAGRHDEALARFREAVDAYTLRGTPAQLRIAHWQVARTLRDLKRHDEAMAILTRLQAETDAAQAPDGYIHEELAENLDALGRPQEAQPHFARAYELLSQDPWFAKDQPARLARLAARARGQSR